MSVLQLPDSWMERFSDWMNPILVKETRQALKSRSFVATFMLLLIASWLICIFGVVASGATLEFGAPSRGFFQSFFVVLSAAVLIVVPFSAFRSLLSEQDSQTYELLSITSLSPRQIVLGKLSNSVVQILVYYSAIAPFIAFTSLLQGFDLFATIILLLVLKGTAILLCAFTLMLSTVASNKQIQALSSLFIVGGLVSIFFGMWTFSYALMQGEMDLNNDFYIGLACWVLVGASYLVLFLQIAVSQLMFDSGNKSTGVRMIASLQFLLAWGLLIVSHYFYGSSIDDDTFGVVIVLSLIHWGIFGFFITMERNDLSRRIRRDLPENTLMRILMIPFMPGGSRGLMLMLLNMLILIGLMTIISPMVSGIDVDFVIMVACVTFYLVFYLGLGCLLSRWLLKISNDLKPMHARTLLIVIFAFASITPYIILGAMNHFKSYNVAYHPLQITDPISTTIEVSDGGTQEFIFLVLMFAAIIMVGLNLPAMLKGAYEIISPKRPKPHEVN